jgi:hypothetical protein
MVKFILLPVHLALRYLSINSDVVACFQVYWGFLSQVVIIHAFGGFIILGLIQGYYVFIILIHLYQFLKVWNMTPQFSLATIYVTNVGKNNRDRPVTVCNLQEVLQGMVDHEIACHQRFSSNLYRIVTDETSLV